MALLTLLALSLLRPPTARADKYFGDVNSDGETNVADAVILLKALVGLRDLEPSELFKADVAPLHDDGSFGDGKVNIADAVRLLKRAVTIEVDPWPHSSVRITLTKSPGAQDEDSLKLLGNLLKTNSNNLLTDVQPVPGHPGQFIAVRALNKTTVDTGEIKKQLSSNAQSDEQTVFSIVPDVINFVRPTSASEYNGSDAFPTPANPLSDPLFGSQWDLVPIAAQDGWAVTQGSPDTVIAVLDSGVDYTNPDLLPKLLSDSTNFYPDDQTQDSYGHGTHVAGIAAAAADNSLGIAGLCRQCSILSGRILNGLGQGRKSLSENGIRWVADWAAAHPDKRVVLNLSYGDDDQDSGEADAVTYALSKGVVVVAAAGNDHTSLPFYPAGYPGVISVGAVGPDDQRAEFSNYGDWITVAAPGVNITSLLPSQSFLGIAHEGKTALNGTSQAAPLVAGLAGLILSENHALTPQQVKDLIVNNADAITGDFFWPSYKRINVLKTLANTPTLNPKAPVALSQSLTLAENSSLPITLTETGPQGDALAYQVTDSPKHGALSGSAPDLTYTPAKDYTGPDSFAFTVTADALTSSPATISLTVHSDAATAGGLSFWVFPQPDPQTVMEGQPVNFRVEAAGSSQPLTYSAGGLPQGSVFDPARQRFTWVPALGQGGRTYPVLLSATDGAATVTQTATIVVKPSAPGTIFTIAGGGTKVPGDGYPATPTQLTYSQDPVYRSDQYNPTAQIGKTDVNDTGNTHEVEAVAVDGKGAVYFSEAFAIKKISPDGVISLVAGNGGDPDPESVEEGVPAIQAKLTVTSMTCDSKGNLIFADPHAQRIRKVDANGMISTLVGGGEDLDEGVSPKDAEVLPYEVAVDPSDNVYFLSDDSAGIYRIRKADFSSGSGTVTTVIGNGIESGDGIPASQAFVSSATHQIAADESGNLYYTEPDLFGGKIRVRKVDKNGTVTTIVNNMLDEDGNSTQSNPVEGPATDSPLNGPYGLVVDGRGNLFIADERFNSTGTGRILKVDATGRLSIIAGPGTGPLGDGGPAKNATFSDRMFELAVDGGGNLYVTDTSLGDNRIRKIVKAGG